ncbi:polyketide synthase module-containing protein [Nocardia nova SH22a]|uniref:Polyketide synthase module-containing protein n=1 Tax=Nocardia nova SH22a TaxID=1415166 RepID=W5T9K8_9NOCA|nr:polyketide synthase [Nocardia nova]AHH15688.1 polyketide synthase module-containing protein [Nocardia nova SH22a]
MTSATKANIDHIVISGMAVEAPGGIDGPGDLWSALTDAREMIGPFPRDRGWPIEEMLSLSELDGWGEVPDAGGFLDRAAEFDPTFFGIGQREALAADPQQRVALRVAWKALENSGVNPGAVDGEEGGCFIGTLPMEYGPRGAEVNEYTGYRVVGQVTMSVAGRVSHCLGLTGPSVTVDTACTSSLTALHLAAAAVRDGECDWALAGGVCVMGSPILFYEFAKYNALSADGHCRSYADDATGTLWGEGAGFVLVEKESRARALGHRIYGRLLASAHNHNGKGKPILTPRVDAQERVIRKTLRLAGIDPAEVELIEGHGTATRAGDPVELIALQNTYGATESAPMVGSMKSNIGHTQAAAGVLGLIKVLLAGRHGHIPPSLFSGRPTTKVDWDSSSLRLATELRPWEAHDGVRCGAVSAFGAGGANAHAIVAMPEDQEEQR